LIYPAPTFLSVGNVLSAIPMAHNKEEKDALEESVLV